MPTRSSSTGIRSQRASSPAAPGPAASPRWLPPLIGVAVLAAGFTVHRGALDYFFSADDFGWLGHARGVLPPLESLSRWIPYRLFWSAASAVFGLEPRPYHAASLLAHLAASVLLLAWLGRRVGWPAAAVGAAFFATHPSLYTAVYWISAIGDPLAVAFALLALILLERQDRARWLSVAAFALALSCKESVAALPLATFLLPPVRPSPQAGRPAPARGAAQAGGVAATLRDPVRWAMLGAGAVLAAVYFASDQLGLRSGESAPYALGGAGVVVRNLLTYAGWTLNFLTPTVTSFSDAIDPSVFGWGVATVAVGVAGCFVPALRARGWLGGVALFGAGLLPVLPLEHHTYHYYLLPALTGAALCVALLFHQVTGRLSIPVANGIASVLALLLTWNGAVLVRKVERFPFTIEGLRSDPIVDRARIAGNMIEGLRSSGIPPDARLMLWSPTSRALENLADTSRWSYGERNARAALYEGVGVRLFFPRLREVRFVPAFTPAGDSVWYALYRVDGNLRAAPAPVIERAITRVEADTTR